MPKPIYETLNMLIEKHTKLFGYPPAKLWLPDDQYLEFLGIPERTMDSYGDCYFKGVEVHKAKPNPNRRNSHDDRS